MFTGIMPVSEENLDHLDILYLGKGALKWTHTLYIFSFFQVRNKSHLKAKSC